MNPASDIIESRAAGRPIRLTFVAFLQGAFAARGDDIREACAVVARVSSLTEPRHGSDTATRMAARLGDGHTVASAVEAEMRYRWRLALQSPVLCRPKAGVVAFP